MRKVLATLVLFLSLVAVLTPIHALRAKGVTPPGVTRALQLFIPIACTSEKAFQFHMGTGFPVGEHLVMTARHIDCKEVFGPDAITEISDDGGTHWVRVADEDNNPSSRYDVRIYFLPNVHFKNVAHFRTPVLGESTTGYGVAFGDMVDFGRVMKLKGEFVYTSAPAVGGMSGSAIIADDGDVIGIACQGEPTQIGDYVSFWPTSGPNGDTLAGLLQTYKDFFKR